MSVTAHELAARIRAARQAAGLTQEAVAGELGLSRPAVSQMEAGKRAVSSLELERFARMCGRGMDDFFDDAFSSEQSATVALFRRHPGLSKESDLREAVGEAVTFGRAVVNLEGLLQMDSRETVAVEYRTPPLKGKWDAIQQGEEVAEAERGRLGLGAEPLPDLVSLMERQGVRAVVAPMPTEVSGLTLVENGAGVVVAVNGRHGFNRQRFSLAHEYAHVLLDRDRQACLSHREDRDSLMEVRANSFAAAFLLPAEGVRCFADYLGKGRAGRTRRQVSDGRDVAAAERRLPAASQELRLHDLAMLAHHFGVSRVATLYRLKSLGIVTERRRSALAERNVRHGRRAASLLGLRNGDALSRRAPRKRLLTLGIEALERELISYGKLLELAELVDVGEDDLEELVVAAGIDPRPPVDATRVELSAQKLQKGDSDGNSDLRRERADQLVDCRQSRPVSDLAGFDVCGSEGGCGGSRSSSASPAARPGHGGGRS